MKVEAITPTVAAASPLHPDHDRWVKERTLAMEVEHACILGGSFRNAEDENMRQLTRLSSASKMPDKPKAAARKLRSERVAQRGVTVRAPQKDLTRQQLSPCCRCGTCRRCKRERRILLMSEKARTGDMRLVAILWNLSMVAQQAKDGTGRFFEMTARDANRVVIALIEKVCDDSVMGMGAWR